MLTFLLLALTVATISSQKPAQTPYELKIQEFEKCSPKLSPDDVQLNVAVAFASGLQNVCCECIENARNSKNSKLDPRYKAVKVSAQEHKRDPSWLVREVFEKTCADTKIGVGCILEKSGPPYGNVHTWLGGTLLTIPSGDVVCVIRRY